ncbi:anthranilate 1,2-dioxygenase system ferredoxin--NAD(+) reductase component [Arthrobacter sp. Hiyo8]|nr:anthranilate 1,2-dioxygenase system ferredoxin--NAD(+) reductase component [Arthrobacter sp. Hiyo8]
MAVGVVPDTALAEAAGLEIRNGIVVDASLRTSSPDVFAAGDVANALHPFTGEHHRSEHWSNALNGGKVAAKAMLGQDAMLDVVPYFYTDQFDVSMEYWDIPRSRQVPCPSSAARWRKTPSSRSGYGMAPSWRA